MKGSTQHTIKRRVVFAEIHQDTRGAGPHIFSIKYRKKDGSIGYKARASKSLKSFSGEKKFRQNVSLNHILLIYDHDTKQHREILIDLLVEYNGYLIDHSV